MVFNCFNVSWLQIVFSLIRPARLGEVSDRGFQRVDSGFSTCCLPLFNTMQRYEELVDGCRTLADIVAHCQLLSVIVGNGVKNVRKFLA